MPRVAFHTFGCKLNFAETSGISRQMTDTGYLLVDFRQQADVYVVHSCMVTSNAERKTITAIRQAHRRNPAARIVVIGCMAELQKEKLLNEAGVAFILGNDEKYRLTGFLLNKCIAQSEKQTCNFIPSWSVNERTRSFLKIQDGCDYFCAYCTIPLARGRSRSGSIPEIVAAVKEIAASGVREIVLTGVNIGDFGRHQKQSLFELILKLEMLSGIERIRISSIEPDLLDERIIDLAAAGGKLLPHFHIPLQSGSDTLLLLMNRRYKTDLFAEKVGAIRKKIPLACIATDIIAGFPGETDELFLESYNFLENLDISYMHVFTYSERKNTAAEKLPQIIPTAIRKKRSQKLHLLSEKKLADFYKKNAGISAQVFFESNNKKGFIYGFTENYVKARHCWDPGLINRIVSVRLTSLFATNCFDTEILQ
jgi:threonylcarbamoyladenosine tRNA methylthiotransferase MtaB